MDNKKFSAHGLEFFAVLLVCFSVCLSLFQLNSTGGTSFNQGMRSLSQGWYYLDKGSVVPVTLPCTIQLDSQQDLVLCYNSLSQEDIGLTISTDGGLYRLNIALDDTVLYSYDDSGFPRNSPMRAKLHCSAALPLTLENQVLSLTYQNQGDGIFEVGPVHIGLSDTIFRDYCAQESFTLAAVFAMGSLSMVAAGIDLYLRLAHVKVRRFFNVSIFLLLCGTWFALDSALAQHLAGESPIICYLSFYAFMLMAIPTLHFISHTGEMERYPIFDWLIRAFYLNIFIQSILDFLGVFSFIDMLWATHLLLVITCIAAPLMMYHEYRRTGNRELKSVLAAFAVLISSGLLALFLYWGWSISFYDIIYECGLLFFIAYLLFYLTLTMANNMRFKSEAEIYKQLSVEDRLTGLANRRSFDEFLSLLSDNAEVYQNAALIFLDMNWLKYINDNFGHTAGDEMIVRAARCIEDAFAKQGSCYRIGGDEFAVIMLDPVGCEADWNRWLDHAIQRHNQNGQHPLSIARGISLLRDQDNRLKTVSDWKFEADQAMYRYKKQQKQWPFPDN